DSALQAGAAGGGGSSALLGRPNYQKRSVLSRGRGVPDVAMIADPTPGVAIYCSTTPDCINTRNVNPWRTVGGTSVGTPLLAGGVALVDQELSGHRRSPLGLVNPLLYSAGRSSATANVFYDVTQVGNDVGPQISSTGRPLG